jgi:hypothetical protein
MKYLFQSALVVAMGVALAGCEWGGSGDDNSWNDSSSIANFSGNYQGNGTYLVSEYTVTSTGSGGSTTITTPVNSESQGSAALGNTTFSGTAANVPVSGSTVTLSLAGDLGNFTDDGAGHLSGQYHTRSGDSFLYNATGTINYNNGQWTLTLAAGAPLGENSSFTISYSYVTGGTGGTTSTGSAGSSGVTIYSFNVQQSGNKVKIIDNNGSVYEGSLGDVRTTGNLSSSSSGSGLVAGDQVIAPFSAAGKSKSGMYVNMAGNFQGTVAGVTSVSEVSGSTTTIKTSFALTSRVIQGTWIEDGGKTGDIKGLCPSSVSVSTSSSTSTNAP